MLRTGLLLIVLVALAANVEAQRGSGGRGGRGGRGGGPNFRACRSVISPRSMKEAHKTFKDQCKEEKENGEIGDTREDFKKCVVGKFGWLTADGTSFDVDAFKTTIEARLEEAATNLSDEQKSAVIDSGYDECITEELTEKFAFKKMMRCLIKTCAEAGDGEVTIGPVDPEVTSG